MAKWPKQGKENAEFAECRGRRGGRRETNHRGAEAQRSAPSRSSCDPSARPKRRLRDRRVRGRACEENAECAECRGRRGGRREEESRERRAESRARRMESGTLGMSRGALDPRVCAPDHGSGARAHRSGARAQCSDARAQCSGARAHGSGARAHGSGARAHGSGARAHGSGAQAHSSGARAHGSGARAHGSGFGRILRVGVGLRWICGVCGPLGSCRVRCSSVRPIFGGTLAMNARTRR